MSNYLTQIQLSYKITKWNCHYSAAYCSCAMHAFFKVFWMTNVLIGPWLYVLPNPSVLQGSFCNLLTPPLRDQYPPSLWRSSSVSEPLRLRFHWAERAKMVACEHEISMFRKMIQTLTTFLLCSLRQHKFDQKFSKSFSEAITLVVSVTWSSRNHSDHINVD